MLIPAYMTPTEKSLYRNYLSQLDTQKQYQIAKLITDIFSCRRPCNYNGIHEYLKETIQQIAVSPHSEKYLLKLYNYALFHLDVDVPLMCNAILFLMEAIQTNVSIRSYELFTRNLSTLSEHLSTKIMSNNNFHSSNENQEKEFCDDFSEDWTDFSDLIYEDEDEEEMEEFYEEEFVYD